MAALEFEDVAGGQRETGRFREGLLRAFAPMKRWYDRRRTLARLSQLSERQLRDVGQDPDEVFSATNGRPAPLWEKPHIRPDIR